MRISSPRLVLAAASGAVLGNEHDNATVERLPKPGRDARLPRRTGNRYLAMVTATILIAATRAPALGAPPPADTPTAHDRGSRVIEFGGASVGLGFGLSNDDDAYFSVVIPMSLTWMVVEMLRLGVFVDVTIGINPAATSLLFESENGQDETAGLIGVAFGGSIGIGDRTANPVALDVLVGYDIQEARCLRYLTRDGVVECVEEEPRGEGGLLLGARAVIYKGDGMLAFTLTHSAARQTTLVLGFSGRFGATPRD